MQYKPVVISCVPAVDVDECRIGSHKCGKNSTCVNALGSYTCFCNVGFTGWDSWDGKQQCSGTVIL